MELEGRVPAEDLFGQVAGAGQHVAVEREQFGSRGRGRGRGRSRAGCRAGSGRCCAASCRFRRSAASGFRWPPCLRGSRPRQPRGGRSRRPCGWRYRPDRRRCRGIWTWRGPARRGSSRRWRRGSRARGRAEPPRSAETSGTSRGAGRRPPDKGTRVPFAVLEGGIGGLQVRVGLADGKPTDAGVEPDVENVGFLAEVRAAAVGAGGAGGQQLRLSRRCARPRRLRARRDRRSCG